MIRYFFKEILRFLSLRCIFGTNTLLPSIILLLCKSFSCCLDNFDAEGVFDWIVTKVSLLFLLLLFPTISRAQTDFSLFTFSRLYYDLYRVPTHFFFFAKNNTHIAFTVHRQITSKLPPFSPLTQSLQFCPFPLKTRFHSSLPRLNVCISINFLFFLYSSLIFTIP